MTAKLVLASGSSIRRQLLENAGVPVDVSVARIDEDTIKDSLLAEGASAREVADALAEGKARRVALRQPDDYVLGCDQVLSFKGKLISKCATAEEARSLLSELRGERHMLLSAAVIFREGRPVWRHIGEVRLTMADFSDAYLDDYLSRNWPDVQDAIGCYKLESEGARLFSRIDGDYFNVLGLPLLPLLAYLSQRGVIAS